MSRGLASEVCRNDTSLASCRERWGLSDNIVDTGTTLFELMLGAAIMATLAAMAVPRLLETGDEMQARAAARYVAAQGLSVRAYAARTGAAVGLRFEQDRLYFHWTRWIGYVDGDGVSRAEEKLDHGGGSKFLTAAWRGETSGSRSGRVLAGFLVVFEAIAVAVQLEDVDVMGQPVEQRASHPFGAEDLGPFVEGQIRGHARRCVLVALGEDLDQQLGAGLRQRDVAELGHDQ